MYETKYLIQMSDPRLVDLIKPLVKPPMDVFLSCTPILTSEIKGPWFVWCLKHQIVVCWVYLDHFEFHRDASDPDGLIIPASDPESIPKFIEALDRCCRAK